MSNADPRAGFTLIEMMAVMMIIALVSTLTLTLLTGTNRAGLKATVLETAALLRRERQSAMLTGRDRFVALDSQARTFIGQSGGSLRLPRDVELDILNADFGSATRRVIVAFYPDGASSGAVLRFSRERAAYTIKVNWFTGGVIVDAL